ncbi:MAG: LLM class flavin-dependent oxidoreductase [Nocardioides sp.]
MSDLAIGLRLDVVGDVGAQARRAEDAGLDFVCVGEHIFSHGPSTNPFVALGVAAGATSRIKLLSAVTLLPLYPAALAAKMAAVLDEASAGRFHLGVGVGGEHEREFRAAGVPVRERGRRADEALSVIHELFEGGTVTFHGRWNDLDGVRLIPPPVRPGGPPIWVAGRGEPAQRRAGRWGAAWMPYLVRPERVASGLEVMRAQAVESGRDPEGLGCAAYVFVSVGRDATAAHRDGTRALGTKYARPEGDRLTTYVVAGDVDECVAQLLEFREAGADTLLVNLSASDEDRPAMERLLFEELAPSLRRAAARP